MVYCLITETALSFIILEISSKVLIVVLWYVITCTVIDTYILEESAASIFNVKENEESMLLQNIDTYP
jgi:uncharacterized membrane protein